MQSTPSTSSLPASSRDGLIRAADVSMHYGADGSRLQVLRGIDLCIARGERVAITGPSGSGKSTLLLLLAGLERPTTGTVSLDGVPLGDLDGDQLADVRRDHIGIVFQFFHLVPSLSALENVALPLEIAQKPGARAQARALLERVGLGGRLGHYPGQLSGGEQQRVAIARALVHSPKVILADEPTGNLDDQTGAAIRDLLFELHAQSDATLVLVTHDPELADRCDRVLRLQDGALRDPARPAGGHAARS
jgi:putative ABC transport system ATP-binding protein